MDCRHTQATDLITSATTESVVDMKHRGWHQSTSVIDFTDAVTEVKDALGDADREVSVTRTCCGYIVWTADKD